jgi:hypothetical protein
MRKVYGSLDVKSYLSLAAIKKADHLIRFFIGLNL